MPEFCTVERDGRLTVITINRPEVMNALHPPANRELAEIFDDFAADDDLWVAIITGEGDRAFSAGNDLKFTASGDGELGVGPMGFGGLTGRYDLQKPVIAAVSGYAVAGGLELALWCDLRVMEEDAVFGVFCRRWGVPLVDGGTVRLPRIVGMGHALDMILTGRPVGAEEALAMGLANRVVPKGTARATAEELAAEIAKFPFLCTQADRRSAYEQWELPLDEALLNEFKRGWTAIEAGETMAGATRFAGGKGRGGSFKDIA